MIPESTVYVVSGGVLGSLAVLFAVWTSRLPAAVRRYGLAVAIGTASMSVAYFLMSAGVLTVETTGREQSVARFFGYTGTWTAFAYLLGAVADAGRRNTALLLAAILWVQWATLVSWVVGGTAAVLVSLSMLGALALLFSLLFVPFTRRARATTGNRHLLFSKLKYLTVLGWAGLVTTAIVSEQNLAFVDMFVGQVVATYIDVFLLAGLGGIVLRHVPALEETAAGRTDGSDPRDASSETPGEPNPAD